MLIDLSAQVTLVFLIFLLAYYLICWVLFGKNPKRKPPVFITLPPEGLSPAKLDYIRNMGFDEDGLQRNLAASLINMGAKGTISFQQQDNQFILKKHDDSNWQADLDNAEKAVFTSLFQEKDELILNRQNSRIIESAQNTLTKTLEKECENIYFLSNSKYCMYGFILTLCFLVAFIFVSPGKYELTFMLVWVLIWTIGTYFLIRLCLRKWSIFFSTKEGAALRSALLLLFISSILLLGEATGLYMISTHTSLLAALLLVLTIIINFIFYELLKRPTGRGIEIMAYIAGFREYLMSQSADLSDLTFSYFEKYYPYAMALQVDGAFCKKYRQSLGEHQFQTEILDKSQIFSQQNTKTIKRFAENLIKALDNATQNDTSSQPREFSMKDW